MSTTCRGEHASESLDPELVKAYAVDFCGTEALKDATRKQVESFVNVLGPKQARRHYFDLAF